MEDRQSVQLEEQNHIIFVKVTKSKSVGLAVVLAILFGPPGLFYASIAGGIVMLFFAFLFLLTLPLPALSLVWVGCIIWAATVTQNTGRKVVARITGIVDVNGQIEPDENAGKD